MFARIRTGDLPGATSFYALHEVYLFAIENAPDFATGAVYGKAAPEKILSLPLVLLPFVSLIERGVHARKFRALRDSSDLPHAVAASVHHFDAIVTYDAHFRAIATLIPCKRPEDYLSS
ncbi:MAG: hypothetical protein FJ245_10900 [Nitrospira sp.]|nr:hypothetical protein [Nitrospira sp.]